MMSSSKRGVAGMLLAVAGVLAGHAPQAGANELHALELRVIDELGETAANAVDFFFAAHKSGIVDFPEPGLYHYLNGVAIPYANAKYRYDSDPYIDYDLSFTNHSAEVLGAKLFARIDTQIFQGSGWQARETLELTLTDRNGDGAILTPFLEIYERDELGNRTTRLADAIQDGFRGLRAGVTSSGFSFMNGVGTGSLTVGPGGADTFSFASGPTAFPDFHQLLPYFNPALFGADPPWNNLGIQVGFLVSPGDGVEMRGRIEVSPVPEPRTAVLLLAGLGVVGALARARGAARVGRPAV